MSRLLAIFAHPDDETLVCGGTLKSLAYSGIRSSLVCATRGELGSVADESLIVPDLGLVREQELRCAAKVLGISDLIFLDYCDSGHSPLRRNQNARALLDAPRYQVVLDLVLVMRRIRPITVFTFDPNGWYGHPDHITIHNHAVSAFYAAGKAELFPQAGPAWQPSYLYYCGIPRSFMLKMLKMMRSLDLDTKTLERFTRRGGAWDDREINTVLDVKEFVESKWNALYCYQTQFGKDHPFRQLPEMFAKNLISREYFALAWPQSKSDDHLKSIKI